MLGRQIRLGLDQQGPRPLPVSLCFLRVAALGCGPQDSQERAGGSSVAFMTYLRDLQRPFHHILFYRSELLRRDHMQRKGMWVLLGGGSRKLPASFPHITAEGTPALQGLSFGGS